METKINFPVIIDKDRKIGTRFGAMVLPTTLVIDVGGKVRFFQVGCTQGDERQLRNIVLQAVKEIRKSKGMPR